MQEQGNKEFLKRMEKNGAFLQMTTVQLRKDRTLLFDKKDKSAALLMT
jgi:hypothetical protein